MKTSKIVALSVILTMCAVISSGQNVISVNWTKSISGQKITGYSQQYTASVPTNITTIPYAYEIHSWDAAGNHTKVAEGTTNQLPKVLSFNGKILVNKGQSESVKVMTASGAVIVEKVLPTTLPTSCLSSETQYFYTGSKLVRATYTITPAPSSEYSTKVEVFTDSLALISSKEFIGMHFIGVSGDFLAGNVNGVGKVVSITGTSTKDFTAPITGLTAKGSDIYVLADKLYKFDSQLTEIWNKSAQGTNLEFIADKAVIFNGTSAILYDSTLASSLFTLNVSQIAMVGLNATSDAIYLATGSSLSKIILGSSPDGIEDILDESSIVLYPNPTIDQISIKGVDDVQIEIMNATGQTLISTNQNNNIDVSSLPAGLYFCRIEGQLTRQFIKK